SMNSNTIHPHQTRVLGWYALRWAHISDWFRTYTHRRTDSWMNHPAAATPPLAQPLAPQAPTAAVPASEQSPQAKPVSEEKKLREAVHQSQNILVQTSTVFPFTLFPAQLTIDRHKLTIVYRKFFNVEQRVSVPIEDIKNVQADVGPFLGSLTITSDLFINNIQKVDYLRRNDV